MTVPFSPASVQRSRRRLPELQFAVYREAYEQPLLTAYRTSVYPQRVAAFERARTAFNRELRRRQLPRRQEWAEYKAAIKYKPFDFDEVEERLLPIYDLFDPYDGDEDDDDEEMYIDDGEDDAAIAEAAAGVRRGRQAAGVDDDDDDAEVDPLEQPAGGDGEKGRRRLASDDVDEDDDDDDELLEDDDTPNRMRRRMHQQRQEQQQQEEEEDEDEEEEYEDDEDDEEEADEEEDEEEVALGGRRRHAADEGYGEDEPQRQVRQRQRHAPREDADEAGDEYWRYLYTDQWKSSLGVGGLDPDAAEHEVAAAAADDDDDYQQQQPQHYDHVEEESRRRRKLGREEELDEEEGTVMGDRTVAGERHSTIFEADVSLAALEPRNDGGMSAWEEAELLSFHLTFDGIVRDIEKRKRPLTWRRDEAQRYGFEPDELLDGPDPEPLTSQRQRLQPAELAQEQALDEAATAGDEQLQQRLIVDQLRVLDRQQQLVELARPRPLQRLRSTATSSSSSPPGPSPAAATASASTAAARGAAALQPPAAGPANAAATADDGEEQQQGREGSDEDEPERAAVERAQAAAAARIAAAAATDASGNSPSVAVGVVPPAAPPPPDALLADLLEVKRDPETDADLVKSFAAMLRSANDRPNFLAEQYTEHELDYIASNDVIGASEDGERLVPSPKHLPRSQADLDELNAYEAFLGPEGRYGHIVRYHTNYNQRQLEETYEPGLHDDMDPPDRRPLRELVMTYGRELKRYGIEPRAAIINRASEAMAQADDILEYIALCEDERIQTGTPEMEAKLAALDEQLVRAMRRAVAGPEDRARALSWQLPLVWRHTIDCTDDSDFKTRKVSLQVRVNSFGLTPAAESRLKGIVGPRYDPARGVLRIVADGQPTRAENRVQAQKMLQRVLAEAWKADPAYTPVEPLPPLPTSFSFRPDKRDDLYIYRLPFGFTE